MNANNSATPGTWVDPDDAPELGEAFFKEAALYDGTRRVRRGRPADSIKADAKQAVTVRYSPDVLAAFKATGKGWQARTNEALKDGLNTHSTL